MTRQRFMKKNLTLPLPNPLLIFLLFLNNDSSLIVRQKIFPLAFRIITFLTAYFWRNGSLNKMFKARSEIVQRGKLISGRGGKRVVTNLSNSAVVDLDGKWKIIMIRELRLILFRDRKWSWSKTTLSIVGVYKRATMKSSYAIEFNPILQQIPCFAVRSKICTVLGNFFQIFFVVSSIVNFFRLPELALRTITFDLKSSLPFSQKRIN